MKNKGRRHKAGSGDLAGIGNCKGGLVADTRDIRKMGQGPFYSRGVSKKFTKKKWSKRVRGYFKSQTKDIFGNLPDDNDDILIQQIEKENNSED